jgi:hypothetical protein
MWWSSGTRERESLGKLVTPIALKTEYYGKDYKEVVGPGSSYTQS